MTIKAHNLLNAPAATTVNGPVAIDATSLTVSTDLTSRGLTAPFKATFTSTGEIIEVGAISGTAWSSITRGAEGTTASAYDDGAAIEMRLTAGHLTEREPFNVYPSTSATANTLAIRAAIADGYVSLAPGTYPIARTGTETALFEIATAMLIDGHNASLVLDGATPNTVDVFRVVNAGQKRGMTFQNLRLYPATNDAGRYGIHFDIVNAGQGVANVDVHRCYIGDVGKEFYGAAIRLSNPTNTDGFFCSSFRDIGIWGNISMERCGDSVVFDNVQATSAYQKIGFDISNVPGATCIKFVNCNSVSAGGPFRAVMDGNWLVIDNCQFEHIYATTPTAGAVCYIEGADAVTITNTNILGVTGSAAYHALHIYNTDRATVYANKMGRFGSGKSDILIAGGVDHYAPAASNVLSYGDYTNTGTSRAAI